VFQQMHVMTLAKLIHANNKQLQIIIICKKQLHDNNLQDLENIFNKDLHLKDYMCIQDVHLIPQIACLNYDSLS
jgi:hypothetical protein